MIIHYDQGQQPLSTEELDDMFLDGVFSIKIQVVPCFKFYSLHLDDSNASISTLAGVLDRIEFGKKDKVQIETARRFAKDDAKYIKIKEEKCSAALMGAKCEYSSSNIIGFTGLMYADIDEFNGYKLEEFKKILIEKYPFIISIWKSFGGRGIGFVMSVKDVDSRDAYTDCYKQISKIIFDDFGVELDSCSNANRFTCLSHDPDIIIRARATPCSFIYIPTPVGNIIEFTPFSDDSEIYYTQAFIDVHYRHLIEECDPGIIKIDDHCYLALDGLPDPKLFSRKKNRSRDGKRTKKMAIDYYLLMFLNSHWSEAKLANWIYRRNITKNEIPLSEKEIHNIIKGCKTNFKINKLPHKLKHVWFTSDCQYTKEEKISKANSLRKVINQYKRGEIKQGVSNSNSVVILGCNPIWGIYYTGITSLTPPISVEECIKVTLADTFHIKRKLISDWTGFSLSTVIRKWKRFKEEIELHNSYVAQEAKMAELSVKRTTDEQRNHIVLQPDEILIVEFDDIPMKIAS